MSILLIINPIDEFVNRVNDIFVERVNADGRGISGWGSIVKLLTKAENMV